MQDKVHILFKMSLTITITLTFPTRNEESNDFKSYDKMEDHAPKFDILKENLDGAFDDDIVSSDIKVAQ